MTGRVQSGEAILPVRLRGPDGTIEPIQAILDTGFNDWLTLSPSQIAALGLTFREEGRYVMADGSVTFSRLFEAEIHWLENWRRILVAEMDGGPLLGMAMLARCRLSMDVVQNGPVEISPLE
jgi:clan AA aspartic protease